MLKYRYLFQLSLKVAREEHQRQEQQHLNDKHRLTEQLYAKDRQYQEMIRDTKATQSEVGAIGLIHISILKCRFCKKLLLYE